LQQGEEGADEARRSRVFSAKITPIPAYGTKRLEFEYHETVPVEDLRSFFAIALKPDAYQKQQAARLWIHFELTSAHGLKDFHQVDTQFPLKISERTANSVKGDFYGERVDLDEDFAGAYQLDGKDADTLQVLAHRDPRSAQPDAAEKAPVRSANEPGFFEAEALIGRGKSTGKDAPSKTVVVLLDVSLSMQWEKLEQNFLALETVLRALKPKDRFNVLLFQTSLSRAQPSPVAATVPNVEAALKFVRAGRLRGGTNLQLALEEGLAQCGMPGSADPYLVLLTDGGATKGTIHSGRLADWYSARWKRLPETQRPKTYIYAVGDDANLPLLKMLARNDGVMESVLSTEPADFKLQAFVSKIGRSPIGQLGFSADPVSSVAMVYPLQDSTFGGSMSAWVGQYKAPAANVSFTVHGVREGEPLVMTKNAPLPAESSDHPHLPRLWARARVDALLEKIEREGEDRDAIDEIIRLSRKYKFVTPYTSFLAVPRSLLRPRVIRPGDPVLRVRTDEAINSVIAQFPFGLTKRLRYLKQEDIWQTRFLAPTDMADGTYKVRLVLRDRMGNTYRESKTFVIASTPPVVKLRLGKTRFRRGEVMELRASATRSTRTLVARLEGAAPVTMRWDPRAGLNTGKLLVPDDLPPGNYRLTVIAEDIAHNIGTQEVRIEILP
ncbi:MAG: VWA domain-containing protein, partial [Acidobacteriales bacterium]|nr:VWA domain-containing protein [Terriglobales bacterium]